MTDLHITHLDNINSTNDYSIELIKKNISTSGIVISDLQRKGKGRYGNTWISRKGNIFCSIYKVINTNNDIINAQFTSLKIIKKYLLETGLNNSYIKIKKPNDILVKNKKISGILIEGIRYKKKIFLVAGIGINILSSPRITKYKTTYLNMYLKKKIKKIDFIKFLKKNINLF